VTERWRAPTADDDWLQRRPGRFVAAPPGQTLIRQSLSQASCAETLPSSHSSPLSTLPFPQSEVGQSSGAAEALAMKRPSSSFAVTRPPKCAQYASFSTLKYTSIESCRPPSSQGQASPLAEITRLPGL
jgi:hypothetical protein